MRKELGRWLMDVALFVTTVLVIQVLHEAVANMAVAVLLGICVAALCLAWGLALVDGGKAADKKEGKAGRGCRNALRAGTRRRRKGRRKRNR